VLKYVVVVFCLVPDVLFSFENWCTKSPDEIVLPLTFSLVDFSSACESHDVCYFQWHASKYSCDRKFLSDLRDICDQRYNSWAHALHRAQCRGAAEIYYQGLISGLHDMDRESFESAQDDMQDVLQHVQNAGKEITQQLLDFVARRLATLEAQGDDARDAVTKVIEEVLAQFHFY